MGEHRGDDDPSAIASLFAPGSERSASDVVDLVCSQGTAFMRHALGLLREGAGVQYAFAGELRSDDPERVHTIEVLTREGPGENFLYDLKGTPCRELLNGGICIHPRNVASLYPDDKLLAEMGVEAYVGIPLHDEEGFPIGLVVLLHTEPMDDATVSRGEELLQSLRQRFEDEVRHRRTSHVFSIVLEELGSPQETPLAALVDALARSLHVRNVVVARCDSVEPLQCSVVHARTVTPLEPRYQQRVDELGPIAALYAQGELHIGDGVLEQYPDSPVLASLDARSYAGALLRSASGEPIGHVSFIDDRPMLRSLVKTGIFRILSSRLALELDRSQARERQVALERHLYEAQRRESLGQLAGGIAHDFNNLLAVIGGSAELLARRLAIPADDACLSEILAAADHAAQLCRQMMAYAGRDVPTSRRFDLGPVVAELAQLMTAAGAKKCRVTISIPEAETFIQADTAQIRQVVLNLIKNAVDAVGSDEGEIVVRTAGVCLPDFSLEGELFGEPPADGDYVLLEVRDDGVGMDPDQLQRIFDPYYSTKEGGHGLGLAALLGIVRAHQGVVTVWSEPGRGSTFRILLPLATHGKPDTSPANSAELYSIFGGRILFVDDEAAIRRTGSEVLRHEGFDVVTAANGREAVERVRAAEGDFTCIVMDLIMPVMDGHEAIAAIAELHPGIPFILSSGYASAEISDRLAGYGPHVLLKKPYRLNELSAAVQAVVTDSASRRPTSDSTEESA